MDASTRYLAWLFASSLMLTLALCLYVVKAPLNLMGPEFAMYQVARTQSGPDSPSHGLLILGDSRAKAGLLPRDLGDDAYSLALGGSTPLEGYYTLERYLDHHPPPHSVLVAYAPRFLVAIDHFWDRTMKYRYLDHAQFLDAIELARQTHSEALGDLESAARSYWMYALGLPHVYLPELVNSGLFLRRWSNLAITKSVREQAGHFYYGTAPGSHDRWKECEFEGFEIDPLLDRYLDRLLHAAEQSGAHVHYLTLPRNETSRRCTKPRFEADYATFIERLRDAHPNVLVRGIETYPDAHFADGSHLNPEGARRFTRETAEHLERAR